MLAKEVGRELAGCKWVGVPFAGGMSELVHIDARTLNVNDLHRHVINLARVMADSVLGPKLYRALRRVPFHLEKLAESQEACRRMEGSLRTATPYGSGIVVDVDESTSLLWAIDYFIAAWMPRHGTSGCKGEFNAGMSVRWNAGGGDSAKHFRSAVQSINAWRRVLARANFTSVDFRKFLVKCKDIPGNGIYCDPPFPGPGDAYTHTMSVADHAALALHLRNFTETRVVVRFYDVPEIRAAYPEPHWHWRHLVGRKQTNEAAPEVLIINGRSYA